MPSLLVVDDDRSVLHLIRSAFRESGVDVFTAESGAEGLASIQQRPPDAVLLDISLPDTSGLETYQRILSIDPKLPVAFITAGGASDTAIEAMKLGAFDYLLKPLDVVRVQELVSKALEMRRLMSAPVGLPDCPATDGDEIIGRSPKMIDVYKAVGRVASQDVTVLIRGESGTGKELIARAIYHHSARRSKPFLAVNCAAIPDSLLESELFGHEKGSFTGADQRRIGKFEQCTGGTIFLDEVGDMSPLVQSKLLRLLQEQRFERVGGNETISTDVRIITATNRNLEEMTEQGQFRPDLFYRLNGFAILLPPLRERGDDIYLLIDAFLRRYSKELGKDIQRIAPDALQRLLEYSWPGNVREFQSVLRKGLLNASGPVLLAEFLPDEVRDGPRPKREHENGSVPGDLNRYFDDRLQAHSGSLYAEMQAFMERFVLTRVLQITVGNQSKAAEMLGITRGSLRNKIHALGISIDHVIHVDKK
jgi:two-component system nitrogen regulation response regulator GlnG